jgi:hypothetical protein
MNPVSENTWTSVGKGGRPLFPPEAASAFGGSKSRPSMSSAPRHSAARTEFPADAAAAFGRKSRPAPRHTEPFDAAAATAFGRPPASNRDVEGASAKRPSEFDAAAAAAFGTKSSHRSSSSAHGLSAAGSRGAHDDFPDAFGKKKSAFVYAAELGLGDADEPFKMSAFARKRAAAAAAAAAPAKPEPKKQTYEEMFPSLGGSSRSAASAAPAPAPAAKASGKPTLAEIMKRRVAEEAVEAERQAALESDRKEKARIEAIERARLRGLRVNRLGNYVTFNSTEDVDDGEAYMSGDLDYDAYGVKRKELTAAPAEEETSSSEDEGDDDAEADYY